MKQIYTKIIILLVFLIGSWGCLKNSANDSSSGLTSINVDVNGVKKIIDSVSNQYSGIEIFGIAVLITNNATPPLRCYSPPQVNDTNTDDCILSQNDIDLYNYIQSGTPKAKYNILQYYSGLYKPTEQKSIYDNRTLPQDAIQKGTLSGIKIKYNDSYNYYGHMIVECKDKTSEHQSKSLLCLHSYKNVPAEFDKNNNTLKIKIPLRWGEAYGGSDAIEVTAEGKVPNSSDPKDVDVKLEAELDNTPANTTTDENK